MAENTLNTLGKSDPLIKDALMTIIERGDFIKSLPVNEKIRHFSQKNNPFQPQIDIDPTIVSDLMNNSETSIEELKQAIQTKSGPELIDFIQEDIGQLKKILFDPQSLGVITAAQNASTWVNEKMEKWLGEKNVADTISQSVTK